MSLYLWLPDAISCIWGGKGALHIWLRGHLQRRLTENHLRGVHPRQGLWGRGCQCRTAHEGTGGHWAANGTLRGASASQRMILMGICLAARISSSLAG